MDLGETLYVSDRGEWRAWLKRHHRTKSEIWLVLFKKEAGKASIPYNDAVEEALCFGWIDSIVKKVDAESRAQRFTPRRPGSPVSEMNKERARRLIKQRRMTKAGLASLGDLGTDSFTVASDILEALQADPQTWQNFQSFPESYKRIRIGFVEGARSRPAFFAARLAYLVKMTAQNKRFGMVQ